MTMSANNSEPVNGLPHGAHGFMQCVDRRSVGALGSGALQPRPVQHIALDDDGLPFSVHCAIASPDKDAPPPVPAGGPRDPDFNPFLPPDPELTVGPLGDEHTVVLNKFPVCVHHLVLARTRFLEQQAGPDIDDFLVLARILTACDGLGFYNSGPAAGASQRHRHVQWIPSATDNASLFPYTDIFNEELDEHTVVFHPGLPFAHCFVRVQLEVGTAFADGAASLYAAYLRALKLFGMAPDAHGLLPAFNLLVQGGWLMLIPRSREHVQDISVNSLSYGGVFQVLTHAQVETIRQHGPLAILAQAGQPPGLDKGRGT